MDKASAGALEHMAIARVPNLVAAIETLKKNGLWIYGTAAEGTNALLQALHADPASTLYVGDSNVDVETAHNANLPCCGAVWGFRTREELNAAGAEYLAENSDELYDAIMK